MKVMEIVNMPIVVVSIFDYSKQIKPIRFSMINEDYTEDTIKINRVIRRDKEKIEGEYVTTFTCEVIVDDTRKLYDLRYKHSSDSWILYKI
jgi:uncharacterized protein YycO